MLGVLKARPESIKKGIEPYVIGDKAVKKLESAVKPVRDPLGRTVV
jgi:hypothetical protein